MYTCRVQRALLPSVVLVCTSLLGCDTNSPNQIDCSTEITYDAREVKGRLNLGKWGAEVDTANKAVRDVDQVVERYLSRWKTACRDYNGGALTREEYRDETRDLRSRMEKLDALLMKLELAPDAESYQAALRDVYVTMVPEEESTDITMEFSVMAKPAGSSSFAPAAQGATLVSGTEVYFAVYTNTEAHVYLFQETPAGEVSVLFPNPKMPMANPLPAKQTLRVPPEPGYFQLNDKDIGEEHVYVVASKKPLPQLGANLQKPGVKADELVCNTRGLEYNPGQQCPKSRGFDYKSGGGEASKASISAAASPGDDRVVQKYSFNHGK